MAAIKGYFQSMCGRFAMNKETDDLIREFVARGGNAQEWTPAYSVAPTNSAPILREWQPSDEEAPARELELARWDFKPGAGPGPARQIINARFEKLADRFWVGSFSNTRAIVPMLGYYEWTGEKGNKQPHFIRSDELLAAAGMYTSHPTEDGGWRREFVIITREARDASGEIHDRMPGLPHARHLGPMAQSDLADREGQHGRVPGQPSGAHRDA